MYAYILTHDDSPQCRATTNNCMCISMQQIVTNCDKLQQICKIKPRFTYSVYSLHCLRSYLQSVYLLYSNLASHRLEHERTATWPQVYELHAAPLLQEMQDCVIWIILAWESAITTPGVNDYCSLFLCFCAMYAMHLIPDRPSACWIPFANGKCRIIYANIQSTNLDQGLLQIADLLQALEVEPNGVPDGGSDRLPHLQLQIS